MLVYGAVLRGSALRLCGVWQLRRRLRRRERGVGRCLLGIPFGSLETDIDGYERKTTKRDVKCVTIYTRVLIWMFTIYRHSLCVVVCDDHIVLKAIKLDYEYIYYN